MELLIYSFIFLSCTAILFFSIQILTEKVIPPLLNIYQRSQDKRTAKITEQLEESFIFWEKKRLVILSFAPIIFAAVGLFLIKNIVGIILGILLGLAFPSIMLKTARQQRIKKFQSQLVDSLMILSSSLKAGLSFLQAIEVLCEEMPPPVSQEFKLILKENKWGISLEDSLKKLRVRIPLEEVNLLVTSILIARESGGEFPKVLTRLTNTIRDNMKLKEKIATLTLQGKLQGWIMMFLPIVFSIFVYKQNPEHFTVMLTTSTGKMLLIIAVVAQIVGMVLIKRISTIRI